MRIYVEISKNHNYSIEYILNNRFDPEIELLIIYYNILFRTEQKEYEKMEKEQKKNENRISGGNSTWQTL